MAKLCVFCGKKPESKNKEHVLPQWLIKYTGDPNREVRFGFDWRNEAKPRVFSYKSFTFPACKSCNDSFSKLEASTKPVILKIISYEAITADELHLLLDWFDKVRVGIWLGFYYLDKNLGSINPKFHITSRIGTQDRMLSISRIDGNRGELTFRGCDMPAFYYTPSCFSMIIDRFCFFNISTPFLFSRRIGLPYPTNSYFREDGLADCLMTVGRERIMLPLIMKPFPFNGTQIYQPMFTFQSKIEQYKSLYSTDYVYNISRNAQDGIGKVFIEKNRSLMEYPNEPSNLWLPNITNDREKMNPDVSISTLELQLFIDTLISSYENLPKKDQKWYYDMLKSNKTFAHKMIKILKNNAKKMNL
jgi:hypothetical protein